MANSVQKVGRTGTETNGVELEITLRNTLVLGVETVVPQSHHPLLPSPAVCLLKKSMTPISQE